MRRALLSVSDKNGLVEFGCGLAARGFEIVSTGGTARALEAAGLQVTAISDVTGFPEMMDGRVKTLHPAVHAGILARRHRTDDLEALGRLGIGLVDVVAVNLYPFAAAAARPDMAFDSLVEEIDIGGPSLVRAAAKNFAGVLVVVDPADYSNALAALDRTGGPPPAYRFGLARKAFAHTAAYDDMVAATLAAVVVEDETFRPTPMTFDGFAPDRLRLGLRKLRDLRYGENPHQPAAWYADDVPGGLATAAILQGKELSFTNLLDLDAAVRIVLEFDEPAACVIKHTNPCGAASGSSAADAYVRAREADPLSAFGGIVGLNRPIDEEAARAIVSTFIEAVVAPGVEEAARPVLAAKAGMRVVAADFASMAASGDADREVRSILGGYLVQARDRVSEARSSWPGASGFEAVSRRQPTAEEWTALRFAWRVCAHVKSNTVIFTTADRTLAIGAGQMSRVDAVRVATMKAVESLAGSVAASDAFFPFRDGLDAIAATGATAVVQPGGSKRDAEVIAAADEHGLAMIFTGRRHFRH